MSGRRRAAILALGWSWLAFAGCGSRRAQAIRPEAAAPPGLVEAADEDQESRNLLKDFFRATRLPGGLSDEANEIEDHLGVR